MLNTVTFRDIQRRRYGHSTYVMREVFVNGQSAGTWEDWASLWAADLKRIRAGDLTAIHYRENVA